MQVISIRISKLSVTLGVTPEVATQWLWEEFVREEETLIDGELDTYEVKEPSVQWDYWGSKPERCWKTYRATQYH
jgi:hypothetical protein